ncbi:hypothetical protein LX36DRAFT_185493 [Colletotrichum falcatum]|nr:hypothetical protein LX36DRAFT_185493 [Colletotrichum falcatum]
MPVSNLKIAHCATSRIRSSAKVFYFFLRRYHTFQYGVAGTLPSLPSRVCSHIPSDIELACSPDSQKKNGRCHQLFRRSFSMLSLGWNLVQDWMSIGPIWEELTVGNERGSLSAEGQECVSGRSRQRVISGMLIRRPAWYLLVVPLTHRIRHHFCDSVCKRWGAR